MTYFFHRIHRNQRISYKNSPKNLNTGKSDHSRLKPGWELWPNLYNISEHYLLLMTKLSFRMYLVRNSLRITSVSKDDSAKT